ncbi:MAG: helix-turn-helix domain-containing protein [Steroidobacteraceae bacterium]
MLLQQQPSEKRSHFSPHTVSCFINARRLSQVSAAALLKVNQPKVSALKNYKLDGFSVERLMTFLLCLGQDVEIRIRSHGKSNTARSISIAAHLTSG